MLFYCILFLRGPEIEDEDAGDADSDSKDAKNTQIGERNGSAQMGKPLSAQQVWIIIWGSYYLEHIIFRIHFLWYWHLKVFRNVTVAVIRGGGQGKQNAPRWKWVRKF